MVVETSPAVDRVPESVASVEILVSEAKQGDEQAFATLYEIFHSPVYRFCLRMVPDQNDAEDIASDVWVSVFLSLPKYRIGTSFSRWLFTIARYRAVDSMRRRVRNRCLALEEIDSGKTIASNESVEEEVLRREFDEGIEHLLSTVSSVDRIMLVLKLEGHSSQEVGQVLGCEPSTVRMRQSRVIKKLRSRLRDDDADSSCTKDEFARGMEFVPGVANIKPDPRQWEERST
jgi:RNA polymerase sigma-70 factor, ECF subfamily